MTHAHPHVAALLDQMDWVRSLAYQLIADPHAAEDAVQQTWLDALNDA